MRPTQPGQSALLLLDAVDILRTLKIDYAVIGAMAASVHGIVRASMDADAVVSLTTHSLKSLEGHFKAAGFQTELRRGDADDPIPGLLVLSDSFGNRVDLLEGIRGMDSNALTRAIEIPFQSDTLRIIGLEDFIAMKLFAGSPKDLEDARQALAVSKELISRSLLEKLAANFGNKTLQLLKKFL